MSRKDRLIGSRSPNSSIRASRIIIRISIRIRHGRRPYTPLAVERKTENLKITTKLTGSSIGTAKDTPNPAPMRRKYSVNILPNISHHPVSISLYKA